MAKKIKPVTAWAVWGFDKKNPEHNNIILGVYETEKVAELNCDATNSEMTESWTKVIKVRITPINPKSV